MVSHQQCMRDLLFDKHAACVDNKTSHESAQQFMLVE
jgi:hypothetical protein